ncbi:BTAD domain-containing putative transcriptional regulator [uncultured Amnibacterium sp.]|uniref:AfsR/SARP family transcriptional regulator n=1 Tax=uncultured Amnibacterium sp. TaxID=1631851 RepID=UPI0035CC5F93
MEAGGAEGAVPAARPADVRPAPDGRFADPTSAAIAVRVLGAVRITAADGSTAEAPGTLGKRLVIALALAGGAGRSASGLIEDVWGDEPPRNPRAALQMLVSRLRAVARPDTVLSTAVGYTLPQSDLALVEHAANLLTSAAPPDLAQLADALRLLDGEPAADLEPSELTEELRTRTDRARNRLLRARATALLAADDPNGALADLDRLEADSVDAPLQLLRMRALAAAGRVSEAVGSFAAYRERLADRLGADPDAELTALNAELLRTSARVPGAPDRGARAEQTLTAPAQETRNQSAPAQKAQTVGLRAAPNALLGRDEEVRALVTAIPQHRLTTIGGAGGLGKTRLAHAVGAALTDRFERIVFVELAGARSGDDVPLVLGDAVGARTVRAGRRLTDAPVADLPTRIREALAARRTLLILDNCEQVVDAVAALAADLLAAVPSLTVLTTSRVPLLVAGERMVALAPLHPVTDAAALFRERAAAVRPDAVLDTAVVERVCTRLDGLPLAIELAAARLRSMTLLELDRRLGDRFGVLVGGDRTAPARHRTLFAVIDWSWQLLRERTRTALALLAIFPDGFTADSAEVVLGDDPAAVLDELVEQSLLTLREGTLGARFRMLETVREFGLRALAQAGEEQRAAAALDAWATAFTERTAAGISTAVQESDVRALADEEETLLALLRADVHGREGVVLAVYALLGEWWLSRSEFPSVLATAPVAVAAARRRATTPLAQQTELRALTLAAVVLQVANQPGTLRATALLRRAVHGLDPADERFWPTYARLLLQVRLPRDAEELIDAPTASTDPAVASFALLVRALLRENLGRIADAQRDASRAGALAERLGLAWIGLTARAALAQLYSQSGDRERALRTATAVRDRLLDLDTRADVRQLDWIIAVNELARGDLASAERRLQHLADLPSARPDDQDDVLVIALVALAEIAEARGRTGDADQWWRQAMEVPIPPGAPWLVVARGSALAALAARPDARTDPAVVAGYRRLRSLLLALPRVPTFMVDTPVYGTGLLGLAGVLLRSDDARRSAGAELVRLAATTGARLDLPSIAAVAQLVGGASAVPTRSPAGSQSDSPPGSPPGSPPDSATPATGPDAIAQAVRILSRPELRLPFPTD